MNEKKLTKRKEKIGKLKHEVGLPKWTHSTVIINGAIGFEKEHFQHLLLMTFFKFGTHNWMWTADLCYPKQPLCQLFHKHCPNLQIHAEKVERRTERRKEIEKTEQDLLKRKFWILFRLNFWWVESYWLQHHLLFELHKGSILRGAQRWSLKISYKWFYLA